MAMELRYDASRRSLVFLRGKADLAFWESHWTEKAGDDYARMLQRDKDHFLLLEARLRLKKHDRLLEAGCGLGHHSYWLRRSGYDCHGLDFSLDTLRMARKAQPGAPLCAADCMALPYKDNAFNGYFSLGVMEHFYDGYAPLVQEAWRVLAPGGTAFISFPSMNWLRKRKARMGRYLPWEETPETLSQFYQFALDPDIVAADLRHVGFQILATRPIAGIKGLKEEWAGGREAIIRLCKGSGLPRVGLRLAMGAATVPWAGHCTLLIARKPLKTS